MSTQSQIDLAIISSRVASPKLKNWAGDLTLIPPPIEQEGWGHGRTSRSPQTQYKREGAHTVAFADADPGASHYAVLWCGLCALTAVGGVVPGADSAEG